MGMEVVGWGRGKDCMGERIWWELEGGWGMGRDDLPAEVEWRRNGGEGWRKGDMSIVGNGEGGMVGGPGGGRGRWVWLD